VTGIDPVQLVKRYHAALNRFDAAVVSPMFDPAATYTSPSVGTLAGRDAIIAAMEDYFTEFPDQVAEDEQVEQTGPLTVLCRWRLAATSKATGARSIRRGVETLTFSPEGLILSIAVEDR
jgi:hypothetical protein